MLHRITAARHYLAVLLAVVAVYAYFLPRWADWNQNSRFDLIVAFVDDHTMAIDDYVSNTGDYALYNGHYYSDKAPGMAVLGAPVYAAFRALAPEAIVSRLEVSARGSNALGATLNPNGAGIETSKMQFFAGLTTTTLVVGVLPAAALALVFFWFVGQLGGDRREQTIATITYALATSAFPYANSLVGHQTSAALLFGAFALLFAIRQMRLGRRWLFVAGFLLGYAVITEYPTALIASVIGLYGLVVLPRRIDAFVRLVIGAIPPVVILVAHDLAAFGTPLPVGYFYSALWTGVHETGLVSLTYPHLDALLGITVGVHRGLFFLSPYLLFALLGYVEVWRRGWRSEWLVLAAIPVVYVLYNSSSAMWQGGFGVGPRYLVAALPFLAVPAGVGLVSGWRRPLLRPLVMMAVVWSIFAVWAETIAGQAFPDYTPNPLFEFSLPKLLAGDIARNLGMAVGLASWASLIPLLVVLIIALILATFPPAGTTTTRAARGVVGRRTTWVSQP
jgi:hypothetical protein